MLWTIAVILLVLWALGMGSSYTAGGFVHLLLVIAVIVVMLQLFGGRRSIWRRRGGRSAVVPRREDVAKSYVIARMEVWS
jgi:Family of unknown function (DUF5670)